MDFNIVYNLEDPRPYYRSLAGLDYAMPSISCTFLKSHAKRLAAHFQKQRLKILDFACGFGVNGALLNHRLSLKNLFDFYAMESSGPLPQCDEAFFRAKGDEKPLFEVGGLDIADKALGYAGACGLVQQHFCENLLENPPSQDLLTFLGGLDIVLEVGAPLDILLEVLIDLIIISKHKGASPWLLSAPRPDVDIMPLQDALARDGYVLEKVNRKPIAYRRLSGTAEKRFVLDRMSDANRSRESGLQGDYLLVDLLLGRPERDAKTLPVQELTLDA